MQVPVGGPLTLRGHTGAEQNPSLVVSPQSVAESAYPELDSLLLLHGGRSAGSALSHDSNSEGQFNTSYNFSKMRSFALRLRGLSFCSSFPAQKHTFHV